MYINRARNFKPQNVVKLWFENIQNRQILLNEKFQLVGAGYGTSASSEYKRYWTQNYGEWNNEVQSPLVSGSHIFEGSNTITFLINYYSLEGNVSDASLILNRQRIPLELPQEFQFNEYQSGTYIKKLEQESGCRVYYFEFTTNDGIKYRYPEDGLLVTFGEGYTEEKCTRTSVDPQDVSRYLKSLNAATENFPPIMLEEKVVLLPTQ
jgi:hypothetical protein